jgi:nucleotide-binding universal stress UspA family protein
MIDLTTVLVPTDFGAASDNALVYGRTLARTFGGTLHVLHVVDDVLARGLEGEPAEFWSDAQRQVEEDAAKHLNERVTPDDARRFGERALTISASNPAEAIVAYARQARASLIVMGTHGTNAVEASNFGSVAERVVHAAPCPVLTVKGTGTTVGEQPQVLARAGRAS